MEGSWAGQRSTGHMKWIPRLDPSSNLNAVDHRASAKHLTNSACAEYTHGSPHTSQKPAGSHCRVTSSIAKSSPAGHFRCSFAERMYNKMEAWTAGACRVDLKVTWEERMAQTSPKSLKVRLDRLSRHDSPPAKSSEKVWLFTESSEGNRNIPWTYVERLGKKEREWKKEQENCQVQTPYPISSNQPAHFGIMWRTPLPSQLDHSCNIMIGRRTRKRADTENVESIS